MTDGFGRVRLVTQPLGHTTLTTYDGLNRVTGKTYTGVGSPQAFIWTYDNPGKGYGLLDTVTGPNYERTLSYDSRSRLKTEAVRINSESTPKTSSYAYDAYSRVSRKTWPSGFAVAYSYNAQDYADSVKDAANDAVYWQDYKD